jgi:membrane protease subunit (stomatin/prohibitin family)
MMRRRGPGLVRGVARTAVVAGTASVVAGNVHHRQEQKWAKQDAANQQAAYEQQVAYEQEMQAQAAAAAPAEPDYTAELEKLSELKNKGILTEDEFQAKKKQLLGI